MVQNKPVVDIDINDIFYRLHDTAKEMADAVSPRLQTFNTAADDKAKTFAPAQADIICQLRPKNMMELDAVNADGKSLEAFKQECFKVLTKYGEFFFGKQALDKPLEEGGKLTDLKQVLTEDRLVPIYTRQVSESIDWRRSLIENLFTEEDKEEQRTSDDDDSVDDGDSSQASDGEQTQKTQKTQQKVKGYKFQYDASIAGQKKTDYANATAKFMKKAGSMVGGMLKSVFGDVIDDFKQGKLHTGLGDVNVGQTVSNAISGTWSLVKKLTSDIFTGIDKDEFAQNLQRTFMSKYKWANISEVKAVPSDIMEQELRKQKKLDKYLQNALDDKNIRWPIQIQVSHDSVGYEKIKPEFIANAIKETFATDQKAKKAILNITNGLKDMTTKLTSMGWRFSRGKWTIDKIKSATGAVKGAVSNTVGKTIGKAANSVKSFSDEYSAGEGGNVKESFRMIYEDEDLPREVEQVQAKGNDAIKMLQGEPDTVMKGLFLVKNIDASSSKDSIQDRIVRSMVSKYISKITGKKDTTKKQVSESEMYDNPVVGSLIATLFEDDVLNEAELSNNQKKQLADHIKANNIDVSKLSDKEWTDLSKQLFPKSKIEGGKLKAAASSQSTDQTNDQAGDQTNNQADQTNNQAGDQAGNQTGDQAGENGQQQTDGQQQAGQDSNGNEKPSGSSLNSVSQIVELLTGQKYKKNEWISVLNGVFAKSATGDKDFNVKKLGFVKPKVQDGKPVKDQTEPIETVEQLSTRLVQIISGKEPKVELETFLTQPSANQGMMSKLAERIVALSEIIRDGRIEAERSSKVGNNDWYVFCCPYLKDKSEKNEGK